MTRILKLGAIIKRANLGKNEKALLNMLKLLFYLFFILHTFACFWYSAVTEHFSDDAELDFPDEPWYAPLSWVNYPDWSFYSPELTISFKYWTMLYHGLMFLGLNEMGPVSNIDFLFAILILLACSFVNAFIFGDMATVVSSLAAGDRVEEQIDQNYAVYEYIDLDPNQIDEINSYFRQTKSY